ncbi:MAG: hypothetical protein GX220_04630 [Treponema sp.]|nr:hypothetical protein [Treponema sp.]
MSKFTEKMKSFFDKSVEVSKDALSKTGKAVQEFSDKSIVRIEIKQLENKIQKEYVELGSKVFSFFNSDKQGKLSIDDDFISSAVKKIVHYNEEIERRNVELEAKKEESDARTAEEKEAKKNKSSITE